MKRSIRKGIIFLLLAISIVLIDTDVFAETYSCKKSEIDQILEYYNFTSEYNSKSKEVTIKVDNGSFILTEISGIDIITNDTKPTKKTENYEGATFDYYAFGSDVVLSNGKPFKFKVTTGGTIKFVFAYYKPSNKETKDAKTGCYSYDYWAKHYSTNSAISTFETKNKRNSDGNWEYFEIIIPNTPINQTKTNSNKDKYCKAITKGENYEKLFTNEISYWSSEPEAIEFYKSLVGDCWKDQVVYVYSKDQIVSMIKNALKLWHNHSVVSDTGLGPDESWSINFQNVKDAAIAAGNSFYAENSSSGSQFYKLLSGNNKGTKVDKSVFSLKCDYKTNFYYYKTDGSGNLVYDKDGKPIYNIDANKNYYYAITKKDEKVTYTYHYTGDSSFANEDTEEKTACTTTCEEAVEVKYGPPVASKAGLCFEYQVQVTSRVKCDAKVNPDGKPRTGEYCSPVPYCNTVPGYTHQGGANDEYKKCINKCDGGKYTKSCSNKCYKKVYGSVKGAAKTAAVSAEGVATKLAGSGSESYFKINNGLYFRTRSNSITWRAPDGSDAVGYARYYLEGSQRSRTISDHGAYYFDKYGFKRALYSGVMCSDPCYYTGCDMQTYLNPGEAEKDYVTNMEIYSDAIAKCKLAASCTEKTATFKISVDYKQKDDSGNIVKKTVNYADSTLVSDDDSTCKNPTVPDEGNILLNYQGCYKNCGVGQQYHARWSFPGTWFNNKTNEISYTKKPSGAWYVQLNKFCSPTFAENVNEKWWNYYLHKNKLALEKLSLDPDKYAAQCSTGNGTIKEPLSEDKVKPKDDDWNISASTDNFGYFGWDISIKCFYALNDCGVGYSNYRVRSVDSSNLFPDSSGAELTDVAETGREPGFNWSKEATTNKNEGFIIDPSKFTTIVQSQASGGKDAIYTDENLEYLFNLTPKEMKELRGKKNYTDFDSSGFLTPDKTNNGIARYYSDVITQYADKRYRPSKKAVQCNNIKNLSTGECDNYVR